MHVILISGVFCVKYLLFIFDLILIFMRIFMCVHELLNWSYFCCFVVLLFCCCIVDEFVKGARGESLHYGGYIRNHYRVGWVILRVRVLMQVSSGVTQRHTDDGGPSWIALTRSWLKSGERDDD